MPCYKISTNVEYPDYFFEEAAIEATKSPMGVQHGAVLVRRNRIVARGHNRYSRSCHNPTMKISIHAEISAIDNYRFNNYKNLTMYVVRIGANGELRMSRPCRHCMNEIITKKIPTVYYSCDDKSIDQLPI